MCGVWILKVATPSSKGEDRSFPSPDADKYTVFPTVEPSRDCVFSLKSTSPRAAFLPSVGMVQYQCPCSTLVSKWTQANIEFMQEHLCSSALCDGYRLPPYYSYPRMHHHGIWSWLSLTKLVFKVLPCPGFRLTWLATSLYFYLLGLIARLKAAQECLHTATALACSIYYAYVSNLRCAAFYSNQILSANVRRGETERCQR